MRLVEMVQDLRDGNVVAVVEGYGWELHRLCIHVGTAQFHDLHHHEIPLDADSIALLLEHDILTQEQADFLMRESEYEEFVDERRCTMRKPRYYIALWFTDLWLRVPYRIYRWAGRILWLDTQYKRVL